MSKQDSIPVGNAKTIKQIFSRQTTVSVDIAASPETIWKLLTDAASYPAWNSTILEMNGKIAAGGKIELRAKLAPTRVFKLKIKEFVPHQRLVWGDAMGTRVFTLSENSNNRTCLTMSEKIGGPLFPLFARMIPPFDESFNQFAADLKTACEAAA